MASEREVDVAYLEQLEKKLKNVKNPEKVTAKTLISDLASFKDHQLFHLMTAGSSSSGFDDNFVVDQPITPNYVQRRIAPQTCAINKQELVKLVKADDLQGNWEEILTTLEETSGGGEQAMEELRNDILIPSDEDKAEFMKELAEMRREMERSEDCSDSEEEEKEEKKTDN